MNPRFFTSKIGVLLLGVIIASVIFTTVSATLENITRLRTQWLNSTSQSVRVNVTTAIDQNLIKLVATYENYPELQSITVVASLMDELAGTENRIAVERFRYNDDVRAYNT